MAPLTRSKVAKFNSFFKTNPNYMVSLAPIALSSAAVNSYKFRCIDRVSLLVDSAQIEVIEAVDKIFGTKCVMAGGFPTFLLGKTIEYGDINFVLLYDSMPSAPLLTQFFVDLIRREFANKLDATKKWHFEVVGCSFEDIKDLPEHITVTVSNDTTAKTKLKLYENGVLVADLTPFGHKETSNHKHLLEIGNQLSALAGALRENYDVPLMMNIAKVQTTNREEGMVLNCYDVSGIPVEEKKLDGRYRPRFKGSTTTVNRDRLRKYTKRLSRAYKTHCTEMRRLL